MIKIGLALGAGGARGLAQLKILEAFDEMGIKPSIISGTSIGAIIGAAYASGLSAKEILSETAELLGESDARFWEVHRWSEFFKMLDIFDPGLNSGGIVKGEKFLKLFSEKIGAAHFDELKIPLNVIATDYWSKEQKVFCKGDLPAAVRASYSLPGLFKPVKIKNRLYVDGGMVNPLPYDIILDKCDITVAVDVSAKRNQNGSEIPSAYEMLFASFQIMQNSILNEKLKTSKPQILIKTDIKNVRMLEFSKYDEILKQADKTKEELKDLLGKSIIKLSR